METKVHIIETLALERRVETLVENIAHQELNADLKDLCQMVYLVLLEYDDSKILDLWEHDQINFFLARVIINQYRSTNSPFYAAICKFRDHCVALGNCDINDDALDKLTGKVQHKTDDR